MKKDIHSKSQIFEVFAIEMEEVKIIVADSFESAILSMAPLILSQIGIDHSKIPLPLNILEKIPYPHYEGKESYWITANFPPVEREIDFIVVYDP